MKTIRLEEPGRLALLSTEGPPPPASIQPEEALVRVHRIGVCGTDIHAFNGNQPFFNYPRILGHELGVEVIAVGHSTKNVKPGDRCSVEPYLNCGNCVACRRGKPNCCVNLKVLGVHTDGGMREAFVVPSRKLHPSARLTLDQLALHLAAIPLMKKLLSFLLIVLPGFHHLMIDNQNIVSNGQCCSFAPPTFFETAIALA